MDVARLWCIANGVASQEHRQKLSYEESQWCHEAHMGYDLYIPCRSTQWECKVTLVNGLCAP
jgi:hypothetical protein